MKIEKFLFKKIPIWIYILTIIIGLVILSLYGSVVRHVAKGGVLTGKIGIVAESIAKYPGRLITLLNSYDIDPKPQIFDANESFTLKIEDKELFKNTEDGYLLVSSFNNEGPIVKLFSLKDQKDLYSWKPPIKDIHSATPNFIDGLNVKKFYRSQHPVLFKNGDIVFSSGGGPLVKIDKCNKLKWTINDFYHHSNVFYDNKLYSTVTTNNNTPSIYLEDAISIIDSETGEVKENILINEILKNYLNDNFSLIYGIGEFEKDLYHLNSVYPIKETDDYFKKNDLVISIRNLSTVFVYRNSSKKVLWMKTGPWINNHDAQYIGDGIFSVFSNNNVRGIEPNDFSFLSQSDVYLYDMKNDTYKNPFTKYLENIQMRSSGLVDVLNLEKKDAVIQLNNYGKIIRLTPDSKIWTYQNYLGDRKKGNINWSKYINKNDIDLSFIEKDLCK